MEIKNVQPACPVYGVCGGCQYQDIAYTDELQLKKQKLEALLLDLALPASIQVQDVIPSPVEYHYRSRLDMKFLRTRDGRYLMGFSPRERGRMVEVEQCPIAMTAISNFLPELKEQAKQKFTPKYKNANLVVKCDSEGRVRWGGVGRRSLQLQPKDYLFADIHDLRVYFSLDTFFQSNFAILPDVIKRIGQLVKLDQDVEFFDLYGGVGLFGLAFAKQVKRVVLVEENIYSIAVAKYNIEQHNLNNFTIQSSRVEDALPDLVHSLSGGQAVVMVDPPRQGLSSSVAQAIAQEKNIRDVLYLSCHPESLVRDLKVFLNLGWQVKAIVPFDFFPRTQHLETLVLLQPM